MMDRFEKVVSTEEMNLRIDKLIADNCDELSRSSVQKLIENGSVYVNKTAVSKNYKVKADDVVEFNIPEPTILEAVAQDIPVEIVYEDDDLLVVNKPKGMVVHPAAGNPDGTLVNALLFHCKGKLSSINGVIRPGIVHRIDKLTSGLLIVAKNDVSHNFISEQIKEHSFTREYYAVNCGRFKEYKGTVDAPIGRDKYDRKKMCVTHQNSKHAVTHYVVLEEFNGYTLTKFTLETGRTHQIRVHSAYIGHPVLGDDVYGKPFKGIDGQCLHAKKIGFIHPKTKEYMEFDSELPEYFNSVLAKIK
ncbi:MAG: RluA family pseudouridine synthase [Ruminococcus sp.]|nr:RluA family pseudouridine synthase [Ruminococcus sp.]